MQTTNAGPSYSCIMDQIMKDEHCSFEFLKVGVEEVKTNKDKPPSTDNLDGECLRLVVEYIVTFLSHLEWMPRRLCVVGKGHSATQE
jgi:hypothetical protein